MLGEIQGAIQQGRVVAVLGAGFSMATTGREGARDWPSLLESASRYVVDHGLRDNPAWQASVAGDISLGRDGDDSALIAAADKLTAAMNGHSSGHFRSWLRAEFQDLEPRNPQLAEAIVALACPVLTTNYDDLYERVAGGSSVTWMSPADMQAAVALTTKSVGHLHGHWRNPESIIFGGRSYGALLTDGPAQAMQHAIGGMKSLLFIGCGTTLADPNISTLFRHLATIVGSEVPHYVLCRESEVSGLRGAFGTDQLYVVSYGTDFGDLVPFVKSLRPSTAVAMAATTLASDITLARTSVLDRLQSDAVLAEHLGARESLTLEELMIPPVVLPVTPEQFAASRDKQPSERPERARLEDDLPEHECVIIAGDEKAGLTSTLLWGLTKQTESSAAVPVYVDFKTLINTVREPLERQIRRELRAGGAIADVSAPLPKMVLAIDNFSPRPPRIFTRAIAEIRSLGFEAVMVGVRRGDEVDVAAALRGADVDAAVRYLGRLNSADILALARLVSPTMAQDLADRAVSVLQREHLARTPLTVCLLLSAMVHGETLVSGSSETMLLDAYVNLLMGRGDPHEDARFSLDSMDRTAVLAALADRFVTLNVGAVPESIAIECLQNMFDAVSWSEDPVEVLTDFKRRGLLKIASGQVSFAQSSYLHLFAAKRAIKSTTLKNKLFDSPFAYAAVIRHYAALTRDDAWSLERMEGLLWSPEQRIEATQGVFAAPPSGDVLATAQSVDELVEHLDRFSKAHGGPTGEEADEPEIDMLDGISDADVAPFPVEAFDDQTSIRRAVTTLSLVSNVLRDSELVEDLSLKRRVLARTLSLWALLAQLIEADEDYIRALTAMTNSIADDLKMNDEQRDDFVEDVAAFAPVMISAAGMSLHLSSSRLFRHVLEAVSDDEFMSEAGPAVMAALLAFDIRERKWAAVLEPLQRAHSSVTAVDRVLKRLIMSAYMTSDLEPEDEDAAVQFLATQQSRHLRFSTEAQAKDARARMAQRLRGNRRNLQERSRARRTVDDSSSTAIQGEPA